MNITDSHIGVGHMQIASRRAVLRGLPAVTLSATVPLSSAVMASVDADPFKRVIAAFDEAEAAYAAAAMAGAGDDEIRACSELRDTAMLNLLQTSATEPWQALALLVRAHKGLFASGMIGEPEHLTIDNSLRHDWDSMDRACIEKAIRILDGGEGRGAA